MPLKERLDAYVKEKYGTGPEILPFSREDYEICRHADTGRWFAVFIVKDRQAFGLPGSGRVRVVSFKPVDKTLADLLVRQPGYFRGFPAGSWNWISAVLDGSVPFEDICRRIDESYEATKGKAPNRKTPLPRKDGGTGPL